MMAPSATASEVPLEISHAIDRREQRQNSAWKIRIAAGSCARFAEAFTVCGFHDDFLQRPTSPLSDLVLSAATYARRKVASTPCDYGARALRANPTRRHCRPIPVVLSFRDI